MQSMRDVEWLVHKGVTRFKAMTPRAMTVFMEILEMPENPGLITEAFLHAKDEGHAQALLARLKRNGLETEAPKVAPPPPKAPEPPPTHLWTF